MTATQFFYKWAGWSYNPATETARQGRWRCAKRLAQAEAWAEEQGITYEWMPDDLPWDGDGPAPDEMLGCVATHGDETASLWGIGDPSPEYRRVVEAELACELQTVMFRALRQHIDMLR